MVRRFCIALVAVAALGCGNARLEEMRGNPVESMQWPLLDEVDSQIMMGAGYAMGRGDWRGARGQLKSPAAKKAVDDFTQATLPEDYADRAPAKAEADTKLKALMAAAEGSGTNEQFKAAYDEAGAALVKLRTGG